MKELALTLLEIRTPLWTVDHFLLKRLCDGQSTTVDSRISQKEQKCSPTNEVNNAGDETFEESEFQNQSGTWTFEMEACQIFLKWILAEAPKGLLNPCWLTWAIVGQLLLRRKKKSVCSSFMTQTKTEQKNMEAPTKDALWAAGNKTRGNVAIMALRSPAGHRDTLLSATSWRLLPYL